MNIPNLVYKSLDVGTTYFSTIANFVIEMTLGHVVTVLLGHVVTLLQWSRYVAFWGESCKIVIQAPTLECDISIVIKYILSDWQIENPRWRPFSKMATNKCI